MRDSKPTADLVTSPNPADVLRIKLADLVPEAFSEGKLNPAALKRALGEHNINEGNERYALTWAGKADAYKVLQTPSNATLRPERDKSVNFDQAQHVFIEGENLEVLKVLQKAYFGKVKLIYIDPPYNTGSDSFIYPDRFQESKEDYLRRINDLSDDGTLMREGFFRKNSKESGHYHSNWLSMMLPRLYIARNLLREDGVIFVSCDDNEVHNLRCLMNEVFGEENFIDCIVWKKRYGGGAKEKYLVTVHEYVLFYSRSVNSLPTIEVETSQESIDRYYTLKDENHEVRGPYRTHPLEATKSMGNRPNLVFPIVGPNGTIINPKRQWLWSREKVESAAKGGELAFLKDKDGDWSVHSKQYLRDELGQQRTAKAFSLIDDVFTQHGTNEIIELFGDAHIFSFPKPTRFLEKILDIGLNGESDALVMDFFSGSASFFHTVAEKNFKDNGNRQTILIQLPEATEDGSAAKNAGFGAISEISRERMRRVLRKHAESDVLLEDQTNLPGFKSFVLTPSNFKQWRGDGIDTAEQLAEQMKMFAKSEKEGAAVEDVLYELLLKFGQELTTPIETLDVGGCQVFAIHDRKMLFVLESFTEAMIVPLVAMKPREIIAIDGVFKDSDMLKTNLDLQCRDAGIRFTCL
ncbi:MAG: hypothetical protein RJB34_2247 [Pseudomonadota bacterium]|jgi:adenine-specific DNA-methyltransferase